MRRKGGVKKTVFWIVSGEIRGGKWKASTYGLKCHLNSTSQFKPYGAQGNYKDIGRTEVREVGWAGGGARSGNPRPLPLSLLQPLSEGPSWAALALTGLLAPPRIILRQQACAYKMSFVEFVSLYWFSSQHYTWQYNQIQRGTQKPITSQRTKEGIHICCVANWNPVFTH